MRAAGTGDELLRPVHDIVVAVQHRLRLQRAGVRSGPGFRQAVAREPFHRAELRQPGAALLVVAEPVDHGRGHVVDRQVGRHGRASLGQRFEDQDGVQPRQGGAAHILRDIDAGHAEACRLAQHIDGEVLLFIPLDGLRRQRVGCETKRHLADRALIVGQFLGQGHCSLFLLCLRGSSCPIRIHAQVSD
jgi:hypothetical protein